MSVLEKPDLYELKDGGPELNLIFGRCAACGEIHFPVSGYGCSKCGAPAEKVSKELQAGRAKLLNFITIHAKLTPHLDVPCLVGEAEIAPGIIQEVMLDGKEEQFADEMQIRAIAKEVTRNGEAMLACRFVPRAEALQ